MGVTGSKDHFTRNRNFSQRDFFPLPCSFCADKRLVKLKTRINLEMSFSHNAVKRLDVRQLRVIFKEV